MPMSMPLLCKPSNPESLGPNAPLASLIRLLQYRTLLLYPTSPQGLYLTTRDCLHNPEPAGNYFHSPILNLVSLPILSYPSFPHEKKNHNKSSGPYTRLAPSASWPTLELPVWSCMVWYGFSSWDQYVRSFSLKGSCLHVCHPIISN